MLASAAGSPEDPSVVDAVPALGECCCEDEVDGSGGVAAPAISRGCCFDAVEEEEGGGGG